MFLRSSSFFRYILSVIGWLTAFVAVAQKPQDDVILLKNGWLLRGRLLPAADSLLKIETYDKNIFVFPKSQVTETRHEPVLQNLNIRYKSRGFAHFTELGVLASGNRRDGGVTTASFSIQTVNGYKFNQFFFLGVGAGVDLYAIETFVPVFGSLRGDFTRKGFLIPFYFLDAGYGFNATPEDASGNRKGGSTFAIGSGLKIMFNNNTAFLISAGYRYQEYVKELAGMKENAGYNRLAIRAGFSF